MFTSRATTGSRGFGDYVTHNPKSYRFETAATRILLAPHESGSGPKAQKNGSHGDRAFVPARTKLKGAERELRNTAVFATEGSGPKRHPRPRDPLVPSKLPTVRRAHTPSAELMGGEQTVDTLRAKNSV
jgi:hypothetical protein